MTIHFGTDGWRAVISDTFTFNNLRMLTQAIADAVASETWDKSGTGGSVPDPKKFVVGFDTRFLSDRYAGDVARVLAANGYCISRPIGCTHSCHLVCGQKPQCHCRSDDYGLP
jgi:phosphomannomutase